VNINPTISEWLHLLLRWTHVFAGIMWWHEPITYLARCASTEEEKAARATALRRKSGWFTAAVYGVEKRKCRMNCRASCIGSLEAGTTWLSGMCAVDCCLLPGGGALSIAMSRT